MESILWQYEVYDANNVLVIRVPLRKHAQEIATRYKGSVVRNGKLVYRVAVAS